MTVVGGRYRLDALHARGGMGEVHRATDLRLERLVAVKVLRDDTGDPERFERETRLLARHRHPHLVRLYDAGEHEGRPYLVLEFITGPNLAEAVAGGHIDPVQVRRIAYELAGALGYLHSNGVVHRDVKPSNVLLDESGSAHLTDFGVARLVDSGQMTRTGTAIGSPQYMAPEQVLGEIAGAPADIYALGIVLIEVLTGAPAFAGTGVQAGLARLVNDPAIPDDLGPPWAGLLRAMTARDPQERPAAGQIEAWLRGAPVPARPAAPAGADVPAPAAVPPPAGESPTAVVSPTTAIPVAPAPAGGYAAHPVPPGAARRAPARRLPRAAALVAAGIGLGAAAAGGVAALVARAGDRPPTTDPVAAENVVITTRVPVRSRLATSTTSTTSVTTWLPVTPACTHLRAQLNAVRALERLTRGSDRRELEQQRKSLESQLKSCDED